MKDFFRYKVIKISFLYSLKPKIYIFIILSSICFLQVLFFSSFQKGIKLNHHYIFTFWEPNNSMPGIIKLCIKTWKKNLPKDYKIVILDYHNIKNYLNLRLINKILCKKMTLPIQADAIRVAILQKYGGIWMDSDTIITNSEFVNMLKGSDLIMFGNTYNRMMNIGFIYANNNSTILKTWMNNILLRNRIYKYRLFLKTIFPIRYFIKSFNKLLTWDYLGNGILYKIVKKASNSSFKIIQREEANVFPEMLLKNRSIKKRYKDFYFTARNPETLLKKSKGILMLHNSWTPQKYKKMSLEEFLRQDIMLSHLFSKLLNDSS